MSGWLLRRTGQALLTFGLAVTLLFFLMRLTPGDPLAGLSDERPMPPEARALLRARYGVDQPLGAQYRAFLAAAFRADLGRSIAHAGRPVTALLGERLPASLLLGGVVLFINFTLGAGLGVWQAARRGGAADRAVTILTLVSYATPSFWLGLVLAWVFAVRLHWFPVAFLSSPDLGPDAGGAARALDLLHHLVLPAVTLSAVTIGATIRHQRAAMIEALGLDCVRSARSRGLTERRVHWRHAWRNALAPMLALLGLWLPLLVSGSVFVEAVFSWPGIGTLAADAIAARDYPVILGASLLVTAAVVAGNLLADLLQRWLDPRVAAA